MTIHNRLTDSPYPPGSDVQIISNSEVATFLGCERRHYYAHLLDGGYQPNQFGTALTRGLIGHEALGNFYSVLRDTQSIAGAREAMVGTVHSLALGLNPDLGMLGDLLTLLKRYVDYYGESDLEAWEILAVEKYYEVELTDDFKYGMRLDLLVRNRQTGEVSVVDHKFIYDFYTANQLLIDAQLPKYIGTVMHNGIRVHNGILNQIRYRMKKGGNTNDELLRREYAVYTVNTREIRNVMREQIMVSERIMERRRMPIEEAERQAVRNIHKMNCNTCPFLQICKTELQGESIRVALSAHYKPNEYGYVDEEPAIS